MALIDVDDYPQVRAAIDVSLTATQLPDSIVSMSIYQGLAERDVLSIYSDAQTVVTADADATAIAAIKRATVFLTASYLATQIPDIIRESFGNYAYTRRDTDLEMLADNLRGLAENELSILVDGEVSFSPVPTLFTVATSTRGS